MSLLQYKNATAPAASECSCGSWEKHWEAYSHGTVEKCAVQDCFYMAEGISFVQKANSTDTATYSIPMCTHCRKKQELFMLKPEYSPVPAEAAYCTAVKEKKKLFGFK